MDYFNSYGKNASDIYYVHHDKMLQKQSDLKGGAHHQALLLKQKHMQQYNEKHMRMKQEAEDRQRVIQKLEEEDKQAKELKLKKKEELRKVIESDKNAKRQHKDRGSQMEKRT